MKSTGKAQKMCRIDDPVTHIGYKIIYRESMDRYEIWTQYKDKNGLFHRNRVLYDEAIKREHDLESLTKYVTDYLVGEHVRFYEGEDFEIIDEQPIRYDVNKSKKWKAGKASKKSSTNGKAGNAIYNDAPGVLWKALPGSKTDQLEILFREWETAQRNEPDDVWKVTNGGNANITKGHFRRDGIIDEPTYNKEQVKVLFISAEANDNEYSALTDSTPNSVNDYREYHVSGHETWKGRMRERLAELYKVISGTERCSMSNPEAVMHFAVMDINKRGGGAQIGKGHHIEAYCRYYQRFIRREIEIISPDIVAIIGLNIYDMQLHSKYLGALNEGGRAYYDINKKMVPILRLWQTSYRYAQNEPLPGYEDDLLVGRHAAKCREEMQRFGLINSDISVQHTINSNSDVYRNETSSNIIKAKCPNCTADISFNNDAEICQCDYCGSRFGIKDGVLRLNKNEIEKPASIQYTGSNITNTKVAREIQVNTAAKRSVVAEDLNKEYGVSKRDKTVALLLCIFLGLFGVHHFYCGRYVKGILFLCTLGLFYIGWIIDIFLIAFDKYVDADGLHLR